MLADELAGKGTDQIRSLPTKEMGELLASLGENERHFHTIQAGIRGLASTWVLAACAGIALPLQQEKGVEWLFPPYGLVIVVCLMANFGISVLWIIDQLVYQRLFNTNYIAGLRLEQQFSLIPPVRAIQALTTRGRSIASWVKYFYIGPMLAFVIIALFAAVSRFPRNPSSPMHESLEPTMSVLALLALAPLAWVVFQALGVSFFRFAKTLPGDLATILKETNCREIIDRHVQELNELSAKAERAEKGLVAKGD